MEKLADALPMERAASRWIVSVGPGEHIEKIRPYIEMGFRHLVFHAPGPDQERFLKIYRRAGVAEAAAAVRLKLSELMRGYLHHVPQPGHCCASVAIQ